jgi:hypothetical protein
MRVQSTVSHLRNHLRIVHEQDVPQRKRRSKFFI